MDLQGKVALVTGSSRGIGAACVKALAGAGARVVINYFRSGEKAEEVLREVEAGGGEGIAVQADINSPQEIARMAQTAIKAFGKVDILVNNAYNPPQLRSSFLETPWEDMEAAFHGIIQGAFYSCRAVLPGMMARGWGRIIQIGSGMAARPSLNAVHGYVTAKAGLMGLSRSLALELAPHGITVNTVLAGLIQTDALQDLGLTPEQVESVIRMHPIPRIGQVEEVACAVLFLASEEASFITGAILPVGGGRILSAI